MAYKIDDNCIKCGACQGECPVGAISEGDTIYVIDPDLCTECVGAFEEPQCVKVCPLEIIIPNPFYAESHEKLLQKEKRLLDSRDPDQ